MYQLYFIINFYKFKIESCLRMRKINLAASHICTKNGLFIITRIVSNFANFQK